jgi:hypothetical protein
MHRQLKAVGLALLAVFVTAAVTATAAQGGTFTAGQYPATVTGTNQVPHKLVTELGVIECAPVFHGKLEAASETLTWEPGYGPCELGAKEVDVDLNGCDYLLHAGETLGAGKVGGTMDILCPEGAAIDFEVTSMPVCHLIIGEQLGLSALTFTNLGGDVNVHFGLTELDYTLDLGCPEVGVFTNGTYGGGTTTMVGFKGPGMQTAFGVD